MEYTGTLQTSDDDFDYPFRLAAVEEYSFIILPSWFYVVDNSSKKKAKTLLK